jgi:hypothetical protein
MASLAGTPTNADAAGRLTAALRFSSSKSARSALWVAGIIIALNLYAPAEPSLLVRVLGSAIILVSAFAIWLWTVGYDRYTAFVPILTVIYSIHFALPVFTFMAYIFSLGGEVVGEVYVEQALALALAGLICTLAGYYLVTLTTLRDRLPKFKMQWRPQGGLELWAYPIGAVGLAIYVGTFATELPDSAKRFADLGGESCMLAILILFFLQMARRLSWLGKLYLWGILLPLRTLLGLGTGMLGHAAWPILEMLLLYSTVRRKIPWLVLAIGVLAVGLLQPFKATFRSLTWRGGAASNRSLTQKSQLFLELGATFWQAPPPLQLVVTAAMLRLSFLTEFADVVRETPANVPYWKGESYYPLLSKPIPRFLWKDKPKEDIGKRFGHRYNLLAPENDVTALAMTHLGEFYFNFGPAGVIIGMFFTGLFYGCLQACFIHRESGIGGVIGAVFLLMTLLGIEQNLSAVLGEVFDKAVVLAVLTPLMRMRWAEIPQNDLQ